MGVLRTRLEWLQDKGTTTAVLIDDWVRINTRTAIEIKNNMMTIELPNNFGRILKREWIDSSGKIVFQIDDKFKFYCKYDTNNSGLDLGVNSNDLVFFGDLREIGSKVDNNKSIIHLKCVDRGYYLLNGIWDSGYQSNDANAPNGEGWTAPLIIQHVIRHKAKISKTAVSYNQIIFDKKGNSPPIDDETEYLLIDARLTSEGGFGFIQDDRSVTIDKTGTKISRTGLGTADTNNALFPTKPISTRNYNFPLKNYITKAKPISEILTYVSQLDMVNTENELDPVNTTLAPQIKRAMRFYIDEKNRFHWFYPIDNTFDELNADGTKKSTNSTDKFGNSLNIVMGITTNYEIKNHDLNFAIFDVINYIYYDAGKDMNGNSILGFEFDPTVGAPVIKDSRRTWNKISDGMKRQDDKTLYPDGNILPNASKKSGYDFPTSYGSGIKPNWNRNVTINSDAQYNTEFKAEAKRQASARAKAIISTIGNQKWKGKVELSFYNFGIGDLIRYTSEAGGIYQEKLRVMEVSHDIRKNGAFTTLNVEVDQKEYLKNL